jgi:hypothetical protein
MLSSVPEALGHAPGEMYYRRADRRYLSRSIILWHLQKFQAVVEAITIEQWKTKVAILSSVDNPSSFACLEDWPHDMQLLKPVRNRDGDRGHPTG